MGFAHILLGSPSKPIPTSYVVSGLVRNIDGRIDKLLLGALVGSDMGNVLVLSRRR